MAFERRGADALHDVMHGPLIENVEINKFNAPARTEANKGKTPTDGEQMHFKRSHD